MTLDFLSLTGPHAKSFNDNVQLFYFCDGKRVHGCRAVLHSGACSFTVIRWRERVLCMCTFKIAIIDYGYRCE